MSNITETGSANKGRVAASVAALEAPANLTESTQKREPSIITNHDSIKLKEAHYRTHGPGTMNLRQAINLMVAPLSKVRIVSKKKSIHLSVLKKLTGLKNSF